MLVRAWSRARSHSILSPRPLRLRYSTGALLVAALLIFLGLFVADREIAELERGNQSADVAEAVSLGSSMITVQLEALSALKVLLLDRGAAVEPLDARLTRVVDVLGPQFASFRRVWIADSAGVLLTERAIGAGAGPLPSRFDGDTLTRLSFDRAMAQARRTGRVAFSRPGPLFTGEEGYAMVDPVIVDGTLLGFVGGSSTTRVLQSTMEQLTPSPGVRGIFVTSGAGADADTLVRIQVGDLAGTERLQQELRLLGPSRWVVSAHYPSSSTLRLRLWGVALCTLGAVVVLVGHERRQIQRIGERSRELEHLSQELLRANRAKSELLANVSHELRTPLNAIVGFTELLRDGVYGELTPRQSGPVDRIEASATHLRALVDQVLDLAKLAAGRLDVHAETVDLRQFVLDVATEIEPLLTERKLGFSLAVASVPRVRTDPTHLRQILVNLLGNAAKFTREGGVSVRARVVTPGQARLPAALRQQIPDAGATWVALQVVDTGVGIAPKDQARVFDEFEQVAGSAAADGEKRGTGLGLAISRRLARLLGGDLTVESVLGKGSTFTIWIPVDV